jgi:streptogramin lyase
MTQEAAMAFTLVKRDLFPIARNRLVLAFVVCIASTVAAAQNITEFPIPSADADSWDICVGPDGALWFNEPLANKIGRITMQGVITEFPTPGGAYGVAAGPDGNIWFTAGSQVGRMTTAGQVTMFPIPDPSGQTTASPIAAGSDGNLWFGDLNGRIGRVTPAGSFTFFSLPFPIPLPPPGGPYGLTRGPDGVIWYAGAAGGSVGKITSVGTVINSPLSGSNPYQIAPGPDGALWFATGPTTIGRITTQGDVQTIGSTTSSPFGFAAGSDGNVWFSETSNQKIGRITPTGAVTEFDLPEPHVLGATAGPWGAVSGPDGNIWYVRRGENRIGRIDVNSAPPPTGCVADTHRLCLNHNRFSVIAGWQATPLGPVQQATAVHLTDESGYFWFLEPGNIEVVAKVLNACVDPWNAYWVFAAGLTNLGVTIDVTDTLTGAHQTYTNLLGTPFQPILDVSALKTCP